MTLSPIDLLDEDPLGLFPEHKNVKKKKRKNKNLDDIFNQLGLDDDDDDILDASSFIKTIHATKSVGDDDGTTGQKRDFNVSNEDNKLRTFENGKEFSNPFDNKFDSPNLTDSAINSKFIMRSGYSPEEQSNDGRYDTKDAIHEALDVPIHLGDTFISNEITDQEEVLNINSDHGQLNNAPSPVHVEPVQQENTDPVLPPKEVFVSKKSLDKTQLCDVPLETRKSSGDLIHQEPETRKFDDLGRPHKAKSPNRTRSTSAAAKSKRPPHPKRPTSSRSVQHSRTIKTPTIQNVEDARMLRMFVYDTWYMKNKHTRSTEDVASSKRVDKMDEEKIQQNEKAFLAWRAQKRQFFVEQMRKRKEEEEARRRKAEEENEKKKSSIKAFEIWKKKKDEELKNQIRLKQSQAQVVEQTKAREIEEKKMNSVAAFSSWKQKKEAELRELQKQLKKMETERERMKEEEARMRLEKATEAYYQWEARKLASMGDLLPTHELQPMQSTENLDQSNQKAPFVERAPWRPPSSRPSTSRGLLM